MKKFQMRRVNNGLIGVSMLRMRSNTDGIQMRRMSDFSTSNHTMTRASRMRVNRLRDKFVNQRTNDDIEDMMFDMSHRTRDNNEMLEMLRHPDCLEPRSDEELVIFLKKLLSLLRSDSTLKLFAETFRVHDGPTIMSATEGKVDPQAWLRRAKDSHQLILVKRKGEDSPKVAPLRACFKWLLEVGSWEESKNDELFGLIKPIRDMILRERMNYMAGSVNEGLLYFCSSSGKRVQVQVKVPLIEIEKRRHIPVILSILEPNDRSCTEQLLHMEEKTRDNLRALTSHWVDNPAITDARKYILLSKMLEKSKRWVKTHHSLSGSINLISAMKMNCWVCCLESGGGEIEMSDGLTPSAYKANCLVHISSVLNSIKAGPDRFSKFVTAMHKAATDSFKAALEAASQDETIEVVKGLLGMPIRRIKSFGGCTFNCCKIGKRSEETSGITGGKYYVYLGKEIWEVSDNNSTSKIRLSLETRSFNDFDFDLLVDASCVLTSTTVRLINVASAYFSLRKEDRLSVTLGEDQKKVRYDSYVNINKSKYIEMDLIPFDKNRKEYCLNRKLAPVGKDELIVKGLRLSVVDDYSGSTTLTDYTVEDYKVIDQEGTVWAEIRDFCRENVDSIISPSTFLDRTDETEIWRLLLQCASNIKERKGILTNTLESRGRVGKMVSVFEAINPAPMARKALRGMSDAISKTLEALPFVELVEENPRRKMLIKLVNRAFFLVPLTQIEINSSFKQSLPKEYLMGSKLINEETLFFDIKFDSIGMIDRVSSIWEGSSKDDMAIQGFVMNGLGFNWTDEPCEQDKIFSEIPDQVEKYKHIGLTSKRGINYYKLKIKKRHLAVTEGDAGPRRKKVKA